MRARKRLAAARVGVFAIAVLGMLATAAPSARGQCEPAEVTRLDTGDRLDYYNSPSKSIDMDGDTAIIGKASRQGSAHIFVRSGESWIQQAILPAAGAAVAVDGNTAVTQGDGAVMVYVRENGVWSQQAVLTIENPTSSFGGAAALDGDTLLVGHPSEDYAGFQSAGAAYVFTRDGETWSLQARLIPSDPRSYDLFGFSLALDGDTALIGAPFHEHWYEYAVGTAFVFARSGTSWSEVTEIFSPEIPGGGEDCFSYAIALDGDTALIGINVEYPVSNEGGAYVYVRTENGWTFQTKLTDDQEYSHQRFGSAVALSGETALVGDCKEVPPEGTVEGMVYVFTRSDGSWSMQASLDPSDNAMNGKNFGASVALQDDTAMTWASLSDVENDVSRLSLFVYDLGCDPDNDADGVLDEIDNCAFDYNPEQEDADADGYGDVCDNCPETYNPDQEDNDGDGFGDACDDDDDNDEAPDLLDNCPFTRNPDQADADADGFGDVCDNCPFTFSIDQIDTDGDGLGDACDFCGDPEEVAWLGVAPPDPNDAVYLNAAMDRNTLLIGSPYEDLEGAENAGAVRIFGHTSAGWTAQGLLTEAEPAAGHLFGSGVVLDGDTALVAGGYAFVRAGGVWAQQARLSVPEATDFGWPAAISGDTALVMGRWAGPDLGGALFNVGFVFVRVGEIWTEQARLIPPESDLGPDQNCSVAIDGDTALIAVPDFYQDGRWYEGRAYVYERSNGVWTLRGQLNGSHTEIGDFFACSVALSGDTALVGAWDDDRTSGMNGPGSAFVFVRTNGQWIEEARLTPADPFLQENIGYSVALDGDTALLGGKSSNIVLVFARADGVWTQQATIVDWGDPAATYFGRCLALDGNKAMIGADDWLWEYDKPGGAYLYNLHCTPTPGDLDGDGFVDLADLARLLGHYGMTEGATYADGDIDGDGDVDLGDLAVLLGNYGS